VGGGACGREKKKGVSSALMGSLIGIRTGGAFLFDPGESNFRKALGRFGKGVNLDGYGPMRGKGESGVDPFYTSFGGDIKRGINSLLQNYSQKRNDTYTEKNCLVESLCIVCGLVWGKTLETEKRGEDRWTSGLEITRILRGRRGQNRLLLSRGRRGKKREAGEPHRSREVIG